MLIKEPAYNTVTSLSIVLVALNSFMLDENSIKKIIDKKIADRSMIFE
jgi:hypothetical protein